jgi:hypothetical protein
MNEKKYLLKHYLALCPENFVPKALKTLFQEAKKVGVTLLKMSDVIKE